MRLVTAATLLMLAMPSAPVQHAEPERFTAFAISLGGATTEAGTAQLEIAIDRWSDADELDVLLDALDRSQQSLVKALRDRKPVGFIRTSTSLAYDLHYAHEETAPDGRRRIFLSTDRPVGYWEMVNQPPSLAYPITVVELTVDAAGKGEGTLAVAARLVASSDRKRLYVQNYDVRPVMLKEVRRRD